ncbi:MAG: 3-methyl-2-oxobutanoate hydroxymethyltransferase [Candidatus Tectomicrobia bacterium]
MDRKKITIFDINKRKTDGIPITMMTAYDYSAAILVDQAEMDIILVGDSLAMVMLGHDHTIMVSMDEMIHHCRAVSRGANNAFLVGDMPFMSYQADETEAVRNAGRFLKEAGMDAVKLEGGHEVADTVRAIVKAGIPVMGHIGLTPQAASQLGGFRVQGRTSEAGQKLIEDALAIQTAGCFAVVLEAVPVPVATTVSQRLHIPTIGIGAGVGCDGQVLVYHDMLGLFDRFRPRFVKPYADLRQVIADALKTYKEEVRARRFPAEEHTYHMAEGEEEAFLRAVKHINP